MEVDAQIEATIEKRDRLADAKATADKTIEAAKDLVRSATEARTDIVRQIFNDDLNAVWRELFIRLAPEEPFVPAFALRHGRRDRSRPCLRRSIGRAARAETLVQC